jgi:SAM-dependent methyltransferase
VASDGDAPPPRAAPPAWWDLGARLEARDRLEARSEMGYLAHPSEARVVWSRRSDAGNGVVRVVAHGPWRSLRFNQVEQGLTFVRPRRRGVTASPDADRADDSLDDSLVLRSPGNAPPRGTPSRSRRRREPPRSTKRRTSSRTGSTPPDRSAAADDAVADSDVLGYEYLRVMTAAAAAYCREVPGVDFSGLEPATTSPARDGFGGGGGDDAIAGSRDDDAEGSESGTRRRVVFVGLGSGAAPAFLAKKFPRARVDACEIDPAVVAAACEALGLRDVLDVVGAEGEGDDDAPAAGRVRVTVEDAASYVRRASDRAANVRASGGCSGRDASASASASASAIFLDAFDGAGAIPAHLTSDAFLDDCATLLAPGGVLVANAFNGVAGSAPRRAAEAFAMRLAERVGPVASFSRAKSPHNVVFLARRGGGSGAERAGGDEVEEGSSGDEDAFARRRRREYYSPPRLTRRTLERNARDIGASAGFEWDAAEAVERGFWVEARSARGDGGGDEGAYSGARRERVEAEADRFWERPATGDDEGAFPPARRGGFGFGAMWARGGVEGTSIPPDWDEDDDE